MSRDEDMPSDCTGMMICTALIDIPYAIVQKDHNDYLTLNYVNKKEGRTFCTCRDDVIIYVCDEEHRKEIEGRWGRYLLEIKSTNTTMCKGDHPIGWISRIKEFVRRVFRHDIQ